MARTRSGAATRSARMRRCRRAALVVASVLLALPAAAASAPTITEFSTGLNPGSNPSLGMARGSDGNVWFTDTGGTSAIGRITPAGSIHEFSAGLNSGSVPQGLAAGPDGNLWFADRGTTPAIGRITPAGTITEFSTGLPAGSSPFGITAGPDGNLWFTDESNTTPAIGRITPAGTITEFSTGLNAGSYPNGIARGSDGNLWFGDGGTTPAMGRVTTAGHITEFSAGLAATSYPYGVAAGPDGNTWFADSCSPQAIGRVTPAGAIHEFSAGLTPGGCPYFIAGGADGNVWFTDESTPAIGRITPGGAIREFSAGLDPSQGAYGITAGADGNVWFTDPSTPAVGRITSGPGAVTGPASALASSAATLHGSVRPNSQSTTFRFQYGTKTSYGSETSAQPAGHDASLHPVSAALSGLSPSTTYHYRLVATNPSDTTRGADRTFTTAAALPPAKASFRGSKSSIRVDRKRRFKFRFRATPGLKGSAVFKSTKKIRTSRNKRHKKRVTLARKSFKVPASGKVTLRIRLSKKNFRILKLNRRIRTRVTVTLKNAAGLTSKASKKITLKAPKRKRRRR